VSCRILFHSICVEYTIGLEIILDAPDGTGVTRLKWKLVSVRLEIVLILTHNRCIVHAEHTIATKIILNSPDGTPR
jgi:hypothetical protein